MQKDQLISQSYVLVNGQTPFSLKYYIYSEETETEETLYGLIIEKTGEENLKSRSKPFLKNKEEAIKNILSNCIDVRLSRDQEIKLR